MRPSTSRNNTNAILDLMAQEGIAALRRVSEPLLRLLLRMIARDALPYDNTHGDTQ